jgi:hypothetical protein
VTFGFDSRHLPRSLPDWDRLVAACGQPDDTIETHWLERKGPLQLGTAGHKFAVAKAILAFANRDPDAAAPFFDGHALLVIGISNTGEVTGIPRIEDHQLIKALQPYLGQDDAPRWVARRHRVDDRHDVLIIDIDAPRPGDPIFTLRRNFGNFPAGTVFTRPSTESEPADPRAIAMLSRRLIARTQDFQVELTLNDDAVTRYTYDPAFLAALLRREVDHYRRDLRPPPPPRDQPAALGRLARTQARTAFAATDRLKPQFDALRLMDVRHEETRTEEEYLQEIEGWAASVQRDFPNLVLDVLALSRPIATFTVTNTCGRFLEDLEVEVHIDGDVIQHPKPYDANYLHERLPRRPRKLGPWFEPRFDARNFVPASNFARPMPPPRPNSTDFRNSGSVTATLSCDALRPGRSHTFTDDDDHRDIVLLTNNLDMSSARITVTATARGIDDAYVTEFTHPVSAPVDLTDKLEAVVHALKYFAATDSDEEPS